MSKTTNTLLITGATGFLGNAIAADLLENNHADKLLFLVRADDTATALARLRDAVAKLQPDPAALARLNTDMLLCGDLASFPDLLVDERVQSITHILNAAALASFAWKPEVWKINVEHTTEFARAAARLPRLQRFLYVGTAMISGSTAQRTVQEDEFPAEVRQFVPYTKSKAEIERRLPGLLGNIPLTIARPSIVVGHTRLGCELSPSIFWMFRMVHAARRLPFSPDHRVDIIPVDYCASALIHLLLRPTLEHVRYHVSAGPQRSCSFAQIDAAYCSALNETRNENEMTELVEVDMADLVAREAQYNDWFGPCDAKRMTSAIQIYRAFAGLNVNFDNSRLLAEDMPPPPRFTDYLGACIRTGQSMTVAEQMLYDFR